MTQNSKTARGPRRWAARVVGQRVSRQRVAAWRGQHVACLGGVWQRAVGSAWRGQRLA